MIKLLISLLFGVAITQNINPVQETVITSDIIYSIGQYQNQLYAVSNSLGSIFHYDLNNNQMIQNRTISHLSTNFCCFGVNDQYLVIGYSLPYKELLLIPLNNIQFGSYSMSTINYVLCLDIYNSTLYVGTSSGVEKWDLNSVSRLQSITRPYVSQIKIFNDTLNLLAGIYIEKRNVNDLNILYDAFYLKPFGIPNTFAIHIDFMFIGYYAGIIQKLDLNTKQVVYSLKNHTTLISCIEISNDFMFSGAGDEFWIQWHIDSGQLIRKVNTGGWIYKLLIDGSYLLAAGYGGIKKYPIPELVNGTTTVSIDQNVKPAYTKTTTQGQVQTNSDIFNEFIFTTPARSTLKTRPTIAKGTSPIIFQSQEFPTYFWPTVIGFSVGIIIMTVFGTCKIYHDCQKEKLMTSKNESSITATSTTGTEFGNSSSSYIGSSNSYSSSLQPTTSTTASNYSNSTTQMVTQNAYSIPGYLQMNNEEIRLLKEIAKGGQGTISIAEVLNSQFLQQYNVKQVIVKSTGLDFDKMTERQQNNFNQELAIIHFFKDRPGFVGLYGYTLEPACLVLKMYRLGNMENLIKRRGHFGSLLTSKRFIVFFLFELSKTIFFLHDAGFVHCDLKPKNILLEADQRGILHPILTDFGITQIVSDKILKVKAMTVENLKGFSVYYAAPEQIEQFRKKILKPMMPDLIKKRDTFAIAGLLYALLMNKEPFY